MTVRLRHRNHTAEVELEALGGDRHRVTVDGVTFEVTASWRGGTLELVTAKGTVRAFISRDRTRRFVTLPGVGDACLEVEQGRGARARDRGTGDLSSPMPGKVIKVAVAPGEVVAAGQTLIVVEAMKTELAIVAGHAGKVVSLAVAVGDMCDAGVKLAEIEVQEEVE